eukprot:1316487-Pyramimonas_sp.AAC.1
MIRWVKLQCPTTTWPQMESQWPRHRWSRAAVLRPWSDNTCQPARPRARASRLSVPWWAVYP